MFLTGQHHYEIYLSGFSEMNYNWLPVDLTHPATLQMYGSLAVFYGNGAPCDLHTLPTSLSLWSSGMQVECYLKCKDDTICRKSPTDHCLLKIPFQYSPHIYTYILLAKLYPLVV